MAIRNVHTGRVMVMTVCGIALADNRLTPAVVRHQGGELVNADGRWTCPEHGDPTGLHRAPDTCLETYRAQSQMARWDARQAWRMWRRWRKAVA